MPTAVSRTNPEEGPKYFTKCASCQEMQSKYPPEDYIINANLPKPPPKYWKVVGDEVLEMTQEEKDIVDQNIIDNNLL